jgi:hypothetical protein
MTGEEGRGRNGVLWVFVNEKKETREEEEEVSWQQTRT